MNKKSTLYVTQAAVIAALYVALTYASNALGLAYNAIQFRLSEILTVLPVFTPAAIPGLVIGCIIANLSSPFGIIDIICGSLATLLAAVSTYWLRNIRFKGAPLLATLPPVIFNSIIIGLEIWYLGDKTAELFFISALEVSAGEIVMCSIIGTVFIRAVERTRIFDRISKI
ncbi:MAG: QueT transporter family protein [Clostridia bacterium]|nr:QueT transporter family protein [Clostridia bacterium]